MPADSSPWLAVDIPRAATGGGGVSRARFTRWVQAALRGTGWTQPVALVIRLVDAEEGQRLNAEWRGKSGPTNVLAFPGPAPTTQPPVLPVILGDLVICLPVVVEEAVLQGKTFLDHLAHLVIHGTLHLLGHTHDGEAEAARMEALEVRILTGLGVPDPYVTSPATARPGGRNPGTQ